MKKLIYIMVPVLAVFLLGHLCLHIKNAPENADPGPGSPGDALRSVTDMKGRTFDIADPLKRIALLGGPTGQIAFILGVEDRLCAVTSTLKKSRLVRSAHPPITRLPGPRTTAGNINIEELILSNPDLVVGTRIDGEIVLEKTRIPVAFLDDAMGDGISDIIREIRFYGYLFDARTRAQAYIDFLDRVAALVRERTQGIPADRRKTVFQGYGPTRLVTLGGDTFMQERIEAAGCINAAQSVTTMGKRTGLHSGLGEVSMEQVLNWDPDIMIINYGRPGDLCKDPRWGHIRAVQEKNIHVQPAGVFIFNRPTAESAVIYPLWLASLAYPERFKDIDLPVMIKEFYQTIMGFKLSEEQVSDILSGVYETFIMKGIKHGG